MRARIATKYPPGESEHGWRNIRQRVGPFLLTRPEFLHAWWLEDDTSKSLSISVWTDEDLTRHEAALRMAPMLAGLDATMIRAPDARVFADVHAATGLNQSGARLARMERFEPCERADDPGWVRERLLPSLESIHRFRALLLARETPSRHVVSISLWDDADAMHAGQRAVSALTGHPGGRSPRPYQIETFRVEHEVISPGRINAASGLRADTLGFEGTAAQEEEP